MQRHCLAGASVLFLVGLALATAAQSQDADEVYQEDWSRSAEHYQIVRKDHPRRCQSACIDDGQCRAWAYDKTAAATADNCRLMSQTPPAPPQRDDCCVTGVKGN